MFAAQHLPYSKTNSFSKIVLDYLDRSPDLQNFYSLPPTLDGLKEAIEKRKEQKVERGILVEVLKDQYKTVEDSDAINRNIELLLSENTFTICTAHQPNLFTGPLYIIYKIIHAIKLSQYLKQQLNTYDFVPVFYMGSEDADLEELNHFTVEGKRYKWETDQKGAVGRMLVDKGLIALISELRSQIGIEPYGDEIVGVLENVFTVGKPIQQATFELVHYLFSSYGLIVLIADDARLKKQMTPVFEDDLFNETPSRIVESTCNALGILYNVQANPREINLFYLKEDLRERIEKSGKNYKVHNTNIFFSKDELKNELHVHPERFSPNVILRGLYQETILPNIAFIGGGGEIAYWLQLKDLFQHYSIPFPVLILRNSFLILDKKWVEVMDKLQLSTEQIFLDQLQILNSLLEKEGKKPTLNGELNSLESIYDQLKVQATHCDSSLNRHVEALKKRAVKNLLELEKKMLRAERKKMDVAKNGVQKLRQHLFPKNGLQERVENFSSHYAIHGRDFIHQIIQHSLTLEQQMTVLFEKD